MRVRRLKLPSNAIHMRRGVTQGSAEPITVPRQRNQRFSDLRRGFKEQPLEGNRFFLRLPTSVRMASFGCQTLWGVMSVSKQPLRPVGRVPLHQVGIEQCGQADRNEPRGKGSQSSGSDGFQ